MRNFESRSPRGEKPEPDKSAGGHTYKSRPTPQATPTEDGTPPQPAPAEDGRVYYSRKHSGTAAKTKPSRFTSKQLRLNIMLGALVLVLILSLVLAALLPGCHQQPVVSSSLPVSDTSIASSSEVYDKDELAIPEGEFAGTILPETEEADDDYVSETLFIGDSNTERMLHYNDVTGVSMLNGIGIESMGIGSVLGLRCVRFSGYNDMTIPQAVAVMQPRRIVITFGTNNIGGYVDSFITQYERALAAIEEAYPYADIIIGSIFPMAQNCKYGSLSQKGIDEFNLALVEMAQENDYKFLNWSEAIKDARTGYAKTGTLVNDGVHVSSKGMEALFDYFRTHSYITDDTRPKPLKAIPTRLPTPEGLFPKPESSSSSGSSSGSDSGSSSSSSASSSASSSEAPVSSVAPPTSFSVSVSAGEGGSVGGTTSGSGLAGAVVNLGCTAAANEGYKFTGWSVNGAAAHSAEGATLKSVTMGSNNVVVTALFEKVAEPPVESTAGGTAENDP